MGLKIVANPHKFTTSKGIMMSDEPVLIRRASSRLTSLDLFGTKFEFSIIGVPFNQESYELAGVDNYKVSTWKHTQDTEELLVLKFTLKEDFKVPQKYVSAFINSQDQDKVLIGADIYSYDEFFLCFKKSSADIQAQALVPWHHNNKNPVSAYGMRMEYLEKFGPFVPHSKIKDPIQL